MVLPAGNRGLSLGRKRLTPTKRSSNVREPGNLGGARQATRMPKAMTPVSNRGESVSRVGAGITPETGSMGPITTQPVPGVSGITPGAIERRIGLTPPTMQASGPPGMPSEIAQALPGGPGNVTPQDLSNPLSMIQNLIRRRQQGI